MDVSVIIPARDADTIGATLEALERQRTSFDWEVIVVGEGSSEDIVEAVERSRLTARVLREPEGREVGTARNAGARTARGRWLAFTDSDCVPDQDWLSCLVATAHERDADLVQGPVWPAHNDRSPFARTLEVREPDGWYRTANLLVASELFKRVGGFEDWLDMNRFRDGRRLAPARLRASAPRPMGEDTWLGWRAVRSGARHAFAQDAVVRHAVFERTA